MSMIKDFFEPWAVGLGVFAALVITGVVLPEAYVKALLAMAVAWSVGYNVQRVMGFRK